MAKSNISFNPLQLAYQGLEETTRFKVRDKIINQAGISLPQFYVILRNGRAKKMQRKVFAKAFGQPESFLFPEL